MKRFLLRWREAAVTSPWFWSAFPSWLMMSSSISRADRSFLSFLWRNAHSRPWPVLKSGLRRFVVELQAPVTHPGHAPVPAAAGDLRSLCPSLRWSSQRPRRRGFPLAEVPAVCLVVVEYSSGVMSTHSCHIRGREGLSLYFFKRTDGFIRAADPTSCASSLCVV